MIPLLARKYLYRYLVVAIGLPVVARLLAFAGVSLEKRTGKANFVSRTLKSAGRFAQRRADKSARKRTSAAQ
ncbi:hypothetical protein HQO84_04360 [Rhodococcus fascians]|nr:hypothetical protein [Rhodococcus fascians]MBY3996830.1 hypothetical protein [Rhodococcus fascians]MBY4001006.1 hypothetical protein [Rhodococcus fascians]MBY4007424.1 hypothetical protein [Rhodococcus fascians]MBY4015571.1 hypothetical protein [Rhodococcus fascians]